ncbi:MAG: carboxypeptidase regulatory-like domain-containing protein [Bryobacterales bacterium]|nr:carboxypeptidase regulatory-like domain-containing protein [Bryobacterales bacterium]
MRCATYLVCLLATIPAIAQIEGRIVQDHSSLPVASAQVRISNRTGLVADVDSDSDGRFRIPANPLSGDYTIEVIKPTYLSTRFRFTYQSPVKPLEIRLVRTASISGQVTTAASTPLPEAMVTVLTKAPPGDLRPASFEIRGNHAITDSRGRYRLYNLAPGEYALAVSHESGILYHPDNTSPKLHTLAAGDELRGLDFNLPSSATFAIKGTVRNIKPGDKAGVTLVLADRPALAVATQPVSTDGAFHFRNVPTGAYTLFAFAPIIGSTYRAALLGTAPRFARYPLNVTANLDELTVNLDTGSRVRLSIAASIKAAQACAAPTTLVLSPVEDWRATLSRTVKITPGTPIEIEHLAPSTYAIAATNPDPGCRQARPVLLDLSRATPSEPVAIRMAAPATLSGRLTGPVGQDVTVTLLSIEKPPQVTAVDRKGAFIFPDLNPGRYRLTAQRQAAKISDMANAIEMDIAADSITEIDLPAPALKETPAP